MIRPAKLDGKIGYAESPGSNGAEFQHSREVINLIGSPVEYLEHRETHPQLIKESLDQNRTLGRKPCKGGHRALVVEVLNEEGHKVYRRWCSRCFQFVAPDTPTGLL